MMNLIRLFGFLFLALLNSLCTAQDVLQEYIRYGLENNLTLQQKAAGYTQSLDALKEARGLFYPALSVNARYTVSEGGRVIDFPVGDLLNPVYTTLNQLTASGRFPQVENQQIRFLRPTEQETKLRLVQPLVSSDLYYNARIRKEMMESAGITLDQYKRELVAEIKKAYYTVGMTESILSMLEQTRLLLQENLRVVQKLVNNSKVTVDNLYRSQTELSKFEQELQVARKNRLAATAYFNFLLNKPLQDSISIEIPELMPSIADQLNDYTKQAAENREEVKNLEKYGIISDLEIKMNQYGAMPDMMVVADYGFQGENYRFNREQDYFQASVVLSWNLFQGFENRAKIHQALMQKEMADLQLEDAKNQIALQVTNSINTLKASEAGFIAAESQVKSAREGFRLVSRKFGEGEATLIEYLDARTTLTQSEANLIISRYTYLSDFAEFEKEIATDKP
jgi:outer membrane protein